MRYGKRILSGLVAGACFWGIVVASPASAASDKVLIEVLERQDCAHCQEELAYLKELQSRRSDIEVRTYDIDTPAGASLFDRVSVRAGLPKATPITIVGMSVIQGFDTPLTTGPRIEYLIGQNLDRDVSSQGFEAFLAAGDAGMVDEGGSGGTCVTGEVCKSPTEQEPFLVNIPLFGAVDIVRWSLPALASVIGFLDGFNPCAMWVLVTFLVMLSQVGSRRRMLQMAGLFLVAEAVMYYAILEVWFGVWDFVGMDRVVTPLVGLVSIGGGTFFLYEWYKSLGTEMACRVVDMEERSKIVRKIKRFATGRLTAAAALGIIAMAFSVNVIEFACSIGYPQTFTKIIEMNALGFWHTQWLMAVYILSYMVDDLIVFGLALWGFDKLRLTESFSRWSALIGGVMMLVLGWMLIVHPEWLRAFS